MKVWEVCDINYWLQYPRHRGYLARSGQHAQECVTNRPSLHVLTLAVNTCVVKHVRQGKFFGRYAPWPLLTLLTLRECMDSGECSGDMGGDLKAGNSVARIRPKGSSLSGIATWLGDAACVSKPAREILKLEPSRLNEAHYRRLQEAQTRS